MMKSTIPFSLIILSICFAFSCKQKQSDNTDVKTEPAQQTAVTSFPALGNEEISNLYAQTDKADIIFYDLPISVNQDDEKSAKSSVLYISPAPVTINRSCKPLGRLTFMSDGAIINEADFYVDSLCNYFVFMKNNQPVAANVMQESGIQFFQNIMTQVQQRQ